MRGNFQTPAAVSCYEEAQADRHRNARSPTGKAGHDNAPTLSLDGTNWHQSGSVLDAGRLWTTQSRDRWFARGLSRYGATTRTAQQRLCTHRWSAAAPRQLAAVSR